MVVSKADGELLVSTLISDLIISSSFFFFLSKRLAKDVV